MEFTHSGRLAACAAVVLAASASGQQLSEAQKQADLEFLLQTIRTTHPEPFAQRSAEEWDERIAEVQARLSETSDAEHFLGCARLVALLEDGHSLLIPVGSIGARSFPIDFEFFADGLWVRAAHADYAEAVGARVVRLGELDVEQALERLGPHACGDNELDQLGNLERMLVLPQLLHALGVLEAPLSGSLTVLKDGQERRVELREPAPGPPALPAPLPSDWVEVDVAWPPRWLQSPERPYWLEHLQEEGLFYLRFRSVENASEQGFRDFCGQAFARIEASDAARLVIDLRRNGGGNNYLVQPLIHAVLKSSLDAPGRLFVITDRGTFSAAQNCATRLERETWALFVGEPTGGRPNHFGDAEAFPLPGSGHLLRCSTVRWQDSDPRDDRRWIYPDLPAPLSFEDYREGRDPALEAVLSHEPQPIQGYTGVGPNSHWARANQTRSWPPR